MRKCVRLLGNSHEQKYFHKIDNRKIFVQLFISIKKKTVVVFINWCILLYNSIIKIQKCFNISFINIFETVQNNLNIYFYFLAYCYNLNDISLLHDTYMIFVLSLYFFQFYYKSEYFATQSLFSLFIKWFHLYRVPLFMFEQLPQIAPNLCASQIFINLDN